MYFTDFEYGAELLSDYDCMVCSFDGNGGATTVSSGSDITFETVGTPKNNRFTLINSKYENPYTVTFQICKRNTAEQKYFTPEETSKIQRWLCRREFHKFKVMSGELNDCYFMATFSTKKIEINGQTAGLELSMSTNAPFAYKEPDEITVTLTDTDKEVTIADLSDETGTGYPYLTIKMLEAGDLSIANSMDNRITRLNGCQNGETIVLDGENGIITSSIRTSSELGKNGVFNFYFPRIINTYENNQNMYTFDRNCNVTLSYSPIKKIGL